MDSIYTMQPINPMAHISSYGKLSILSKERRKAVKKKYYYNTCSMCGANLDPGEPCDCQQKANEKASKEMRPSKDANQYIYPLKYNIVGG